MQTSSVPPLLRRPKRPTCFPNLFFRVMKQARQILRQSPSSTRRLQVEEQPPCPPSAPGWLPRLTLGGAICGSFAGSFAGALVGMAVGVVYRDISLGLDGALVGAIVAAAAGAAYGLILALREEKKTSSSSEDPPLANSSSAF
jgi:hypothetical protein